MNIFWTTPAGLLPVIFMLMLFITGCDENPSNRPTPFPTTTIAPTRTPSPTPAPTETPAGITTHTIPEGDFTIRLPGDWAVVPAGLTPLGHYYQLGPQPVGPGPFSSSIFVAGTAALSAVEAAEQLLCGSGCAGDLEFMEATVAGQPAESIVLQAEGMPPLTWYFIERDDLLVILSIHDPETLEDRPDLLDTILFSAISPTPEAAAVPTDTAPATPIPTLEPVRTWRRVSLPDAGLSFEVPAGWEEIQDDSLWSPAVDSTMAIEFKWLPDEEQTLAAEEFFPAGATEQSSAPVVLPWSTNAISYTLELDDGLAALVVVPAGDRTFAFAANAPDALSLSALQPVLSHMLESVRLEFIIEPVIEEPVDAALGFFQALINNESEETLLAFLSPRLREEVPAGESPLQLLALSDRLIEYNLDWDFITSSTVLVTVTITLQNGDQVSRDLTVVNLGDIGWRIDTIAETPI